MIRQGISLGQAQTSEMPSFFLLYIYSGTIQTHYTSQAVLLKKKKNSTFIIEQLVRLPRLFLPLSKNLKAKSIKKKNIYKLSI